MLCQRKAKSPERRLNADLDLIDGGFTNYLRQRHAADFTVALYCRFLRRVARYLAQRGRCAATLRRRDVPQVMRGCLPGWKVTSRRTRRSGLLQWLRFTGRFREPVPGQRWQGWLDGYEHFLRVDRALADCTRAASVRVLNHYLSWQFCNRPLRWNAVRADDLRRYAVSRCRTLSPKSVNDTLSILRQFLRFMHLRGECSPALVLAVPTVADFGRERFPEVLDEAQRRKFLASFDRRSSQGRRDYTMALCLIDLGLRAVEVSRLRLNDIDWRQQTLAVPAAKASPGRQLPLQAHVASALRSYLGHRPPTDAEHFFVGQNLLRGRPLSRWAIAAAMDRAYCRCGFVGWYGTHRLRHSFATRLYARGATTKEIADLLGHRLVATTDHYTQTKDLRILAQPWPLPIHRPS
jgi:integrase/recombinase XerD